MTTFDDLVPGVSRPVALAAFRAGCNYGPRSTVHHRQLVRAAGGAPAASLPDPLTLESAAALRDAVLQKRHIDTVIDWLEHGALPWSEYEDSRVQENRS